MTEAVQGRIWDRWAAGYAKRPVADEAAYQKKLELTRALFAPDMDVLEFGCGTGSTALYHAPHVREITAIDVSPKMIKIAQSKAAEAQVENVRFEASGVTAFTPQAGGYDVVLGLSILHLLPNRDEVIRKVVGMLKPGGRFVSSTICLKDGLWFFWPVLAVGRALGYLPSVHFFSEKNLVGAMRGAGLEFETKWRPGPRAAVFIIARKPG